MLSPPHLNIRWGGFLFAYSENQFRKFIYYYMLSFKTVEELLKLSFSLGSLLSRSL